MSLGMLFGGLKPHRPSENTFDRFLFAFAGAWATSFVLWPAYAWFTFNEFAGEVVEYAHAGVSAHQLIVIWLILLVVMWVLPVTVIAGLFGALVSFSYPDETTHMQLLRLGFVLPIAGVAVSFLLKGIWYACGLASVRSG